MSMVSSENTRDQWNNPLASGSATSHAAFSGYQYFTLHVAKIVINLHYSSNEHVNFVRIYSNNYFSATSSNKRNYNL